MEEKIKIEGKIKNRKEIKEKSRGINKIRLIKIRVNLIYTDSVHCHGWMYDTYAKFEFQIQIWIMSHASMVKVYTLSVYRRLILDIIGIKCL